MSDREIIINWLASVDRRLRANRLSCNLTFGLTLFLIFPIVFKIWDLFHPVQGRTLMVLAGLWLFGLLAWSFRHFKKRGSLEQAAAAIDQKAKLHDQIKTAYWFINNPRQSEWVDVQIKRAAGEMQRLDVDRLYPFTIPRTSYIAASMLLVFVALNFAPLPLNHNWLRLQAAPAFSLTNDESKLLDQAKDLLSQAEQMKNSELAKRLEEIMQQLRDGEMAVPEALQELEKMQAELGEANLDFAAISEGLQQMGEDLQQADKLMNAGMAVMNRQLKEAAANLRELNKNLQEAQPQDIQDMQQALEQAAQNNRPGLEQLATDLNDAAQKLRTQDRRGASQSLENVARDLEALSEKIASQQMKNQASRQLQSLEESLRQRQKEGADAQGRNQDAQAQPGDEKAGAPTMDGTGDMQAGEGTVKDGRPIGQGQGAAPAPTEGGNQMPSGAGGDSGPREGAPTKLDVQLALEELAGMQDSRDQTDDLEEASKQERSKLDYRNVKSELSPGQQDLLNQDRIPWEYRPLIRNYFEAIRKPSQK